MKAIFAALYWHRKKISLYVLNFFDNYNHVMTNAFNLNFHLYYFLKDFPYFLNIKLYLDFKLKILIEKMDLFLFEYFINTDTKQIYNIKKDGLNYNINLRNYLTLQSKYFCI